MIERGKRERRAEGGGGGNREEEDEEERDREGKEGSGLFLSYLSFFFFIAPSPISDVIQVTYSSQGGSLPPLPLPLISFYLCLSSSLPLSSLLAQLTG